MSQFKFIKEPAPSDYSDWRVYGVYLRETDERIGYLIDRLPRDTHWWGGYWGPDYYVHLDGNEMDRDVFDHQGIYMGTGYGPGREAAAELVLEYHQKRVAR